MSSSTVDQGKESILQFAPFQSAVDEGFWHRLSSLKLNKLGIDESPIPITGMLSITRGLLAILMHFWNSFVISFKSNWSSFVINFKTAFRSNWQTFNCAELLLADFICISISKYFYVHFLRL